MNLNLEQLLRLGITLAIWVAVAVLMTLGGIFNIFFNVSAFVSWLIIGAGIVGTVILWNQSTWEQIRQAKLLYVEEQITQQIQKMSEKDMVELADGIRKVKEKFGIELDLPLQTKQKNDVDALLNRLSESELTDIQQKLRTGELTEPELAAWLQEQQSAANS